MGVQAPAPASDTRWVTIAALILVNATFGAAIVFGVVRLIARSIRGDVPLVA